MKVFDDLGRGFYKALYSLPQLLSNVFSFLVELTTKLVPSPKEPPRKHLPKDGRFYVT